MKKKIIIISIVVLVLVTLGIASYLVFFNNGKANSRTTTITTTLTANGKISLDTIRALAKKDSNIDTEYKEKILIGPVAQEDTNFDINEIDYNNNVFLKNDNGKLYIYNISEENTYKVPINNFSEKVVFIKKFDSHCGTILSIEYGTGDILILTENKNLYFLDTYQFLDNTGNEYVSRSILNKIILKDIKNIKFKKVNGNYEVLAFTKLRVYYDDEECGGQETVYTSDKKYRTFYTAIGHDNLESIYKK